MFLSTVLDRQLSNGGGVWGVCDGMGEGNEYFSEVGNFWVVCVVISWEGD